MADWGRMPALTVHQPWAWAIAAAGKDVENRTWHAGHRGLVAIHAARLPGDAELLQHPELATAFLAGGPVAARGAVVAIADLTGCHHATTCRMRNGRSGRLCSQWAQPGQWHWQLARVWPLPVPLRGRGARELWPLPSPVERVLHQAITLPRSGARQ